MIHIVASDLDGTLLTPQHQVADFTKEVLTSLHEKGIRFIFATGRHHVDVHHIRDTVGIPAFMITSNGARVHDENNNLVFSRNIEPNSVKPLIDLVKDDTNLFVHIYRNDEWLLNREDEKLDHFHKDSGFSYQLFDDEQPPTDGIAKIFVTHADHDYLVKYEALFNETLGNSVTVAFSTPWCLEVMAADVSKGEALKAVAESFGHGLENCIAFGDGMNDVEMLSMAGKGLVMATSHEKVKKALPSNEVIGSHEHEAVAHYLNELLLK